MVQSMFPILATRDLSGALRFHRDLLGGVAAFFLDPDGNTVMIGQAGAP